MSGLFAMAMAMPDARAGILLEEGYDYAPGTALGTDAPWSGSGTNVEVVGGTLAVPGFPGIAGSGGMLRLVAGADASALRNFSDTPLTNGAVYSSIFIRCASAPEAAGFLSGLQSQGATGFDGITDPVDLYAQGASGGYNLGIKQAGGATVFAPTLLTEGTTHLVVVKVSFGAQGGSSLFIDPPPGAPEPGTPDAMTITSGGSGGGDDDNGGVIPGGTGALSVTNLQAVGFVTQASVTNGVWEFDTLRVGTTWRSVAPASISITGPQDQATCEGKPATFSVQAGGIPPFQYQWRVNHILIPGATNDSFTLPNPNSADALMTYDVVVSNPWGQLTSRAGSLAFGGSAPMISVPPADQTILPPSSNATLTVVAAGGAPLSYQWRADGVPIPGATRSTYSVSSAGPGSVATGYDVVVADLCGSVTSSPPAKVGFSHPFYSAGALPGFFSGMNLITTNQPGMTLSVWSSDNPHQPIKHWTLEGQMSEQPLNDGTGNSRYSLSVNPASPQVYYLIGQSISGPYIQPVPVLWLATDPTGNYTVDAASLTVSVDGVLDLPVAPAIAQQPLPQSALPGKTVVFKVVATGTDPVSYQWYFNGATPLPQATAPVLTLTNATPTDAGNYSVAAANAFGSVTSSAAPLTVMPALRVRAQPSAQGIRLRGTGVSGDVYWIEGTASLAPPVTWERLGTVIGGTNGEVDFAAQGATPQRFYRVSSPADAPGAPTVLEQPAAQSGLEGGAATFGVVAAGVAPLGYQWCLANGQPLAGATNAALAFTGLKMKLSQTAYRVIVTNAYGSVTSNPALLLVSPSSAPPVSPPGSSQ